MLSELQNCMHHTFRKINCDALYHQHASIAYTCILQVCHASVKASILNKIDQEQQIFVEEYLPVSNPITVGVWEHYNTKNKIPFLDYPFYLRKKLH